MGLTRKLSANQQEVVRAWLSGLNAACEEIYLSFCRLVDADEFPGRARLIGHCIRELRIRLLAHFVGEQKERLDYRAELREIGKQWGVDAPARPHPGSDAQIPDATPPTVGPDAILRIRELIEKSEATTASQEDQIAELLRRIRLESSGPESNLRAVAVDFKSVTETHGIAHSTVTDAELITEDFVTRVNAFDEHLHNFATARRFVARLETLDDILDNANRPAS